MIDAARISSVLGIDLMIKKHEIELYEYLYRMKPFVLVMAPQCTGMAGWGHLNKVLNKETHENNAAISRHLGRICARCAKIQLIANRHDFAEQLCGSELHQLPEWQEVARMRGPT